MSSDTITTLLGLAGVLVLVLAVTNWLVRRGGGWKALWRRLGREITLTVRAFTGPVRTELRYRRGLRLLVRLLRDPAVWDDAERATALAAAVRPGVRPYGVLAGAEWMAVLVAADGDALREPPEPWAADEADPRLWWIERADLTEVPDGAAVPLLVCVGHDLGHAVLLDVRSGPPALSVYGPPRAARTARAVLQALTAQLDARLPEGRVAVASGVHPRFPGVPAAAAVGRPGVEIAVCADPLERPLPSGVRLLSLGVARGRTRLLEIAPDAVLTVHGSPAAARVDVLPLSRAVARTLAVLPPYPDRPGDEARRPADVTRAADPDLLPDEPDLGPDLGAGASRDTGPTGVSATRPAPAPAPVSAPAAPVSAPAAPESVPAAPVPAQAAPVEAHADSAAAVDDDFDDDFAEPSASGAAGVSAASPPAP
ncbi:hypothetical protein [Streptomyces humi]|uniref:hypothetical protein n=1 Tax=Streptomyces humi TaxID=1428620 RepID=UPI00069AB806|nr:hypothetical protein [Streptomyces humi]